MGSLLVLVRQAGGRGPLLAVARRPRERSRKLRAIDRAQGYVHAIAGRISSARRRVAWRRARLAQKMGKIRSVVCNGMGGPTVPRTLPNGRTSHARMGARGTCRPLTSPLRQVACCGRHCARSAGMLLADRLAAGTVKVGETIAAIVEAHRSGAASPEATVARTYARIRAHDDPAVFISLRDEAERSPKPRRLAPQGNTELPLYGVPVAVKDNIDVAGLPTTAACPAFAYDPTRTPTCVARLRAAGAHRHRQDQSRPVRHRPGRRAHALRHRRATRSIRRSSPAARAPARRSRSAPASCRLRSAPTPPDRAACRPASTTSSA